MSDDKATVIIIHESLADSILSDCFTFLMLVGLIGIGVLLQSDVLQSVGAFMAMIGIVSKSIKGYDDRRMTVAEAREVLDRIEAKQ